MLKILSLSTASNISSNGGFPLPANFKEVLLNCSQNVRESIELSLKLRNATPQQKNFMLFKLAKQKLALYKDRLLAQPPPSSLTVYDHLLKELDLKLSSQTCTEGYLKKLLYRAAALSLPESERSGTFFPFDRYLPTFFKDNTLLNDMSFDASLKKYTELDADDTRMSGRVISYFGSEDSQFSVLPCTGELTAYDISVSTLFGIHLYGVESSSVMADGFELKPHQFLIHDHFHHGYCVNSRCFGEDVDAQKFKLFSARFLGKLNGNLQDPGAKEDANKAAIAYFVLFHEFFCSFDDLSNFNQFSRVSSDSSSNAGLKELLNSILSKEQQPDFDGNITQAFQESCKLFKEMAFHK